MCRATSFTDNSTALAETAFGRAEVRWSQSERSVDENVSKFSSVLQLKSGFVIKRVEFLQLNKTQSQVDNPFSLAKSIFDHNTGLHICSMHEHTYYSNFDCSYI